MSYEINPTPEIRAFARKARKNKRFKEELLQADQDAHRLFRVFPDSLDLLAITMIYEGWLIANYGILYKDYA